MTQAGKGTVFREVTIAPGFHFVATPIGTARDITLRALDTLASADVIAAEDTRNARHLMDLHGIPLGGRPLVAYHDHNGAAQRPRLLETVRNGQSVACVSDAGTPLVADPGFQLARAAIAEDLPVFSVPGPSAVLSALTVAGLPSDRFLFAGFPPASGGARRRWLEDLAKQDATLVLFESPKRVGRLLGEMAVAFGPDRPAALCRELTKRFEEVRRGTVAELAGSVAEKPPKGEIVLVIDRPGAMDVSETSVEEALVQALTRGSVREAAAEVSAMLGLKKRDVYQMALRLKETDR